MDEYNCAKAEANDCPYLIRNLKENTLKLLQQITTPECVFDEILETTSSNVLTKWNMTTSFPSQQGGMVISTTEDAAAGSAQKNNPVGLTVLINQNGNFIYFMIITFLTNM